VSRVSIIIPTIGRTTLKECLESIRRQKYPDCEVIIILAKNCKLPVKLHPDEKLVINESGDITSALNIGIKESSGEILVILNDDNVIPSEDWIEKGIHCLECTETAYVSGPSLPAPQSSLYQRCFGYALSSYWASFKMARRYRIAQPRNPADETSIVGPGFYRKRALQRINGFKLKGTGQDVELSMRLKRAGYAIRYAPQLFLYHNHRATLKAFFLQIFKWGNSRIQIFRLHPSELVRKPFFLAPLLFIGYLVALPILLAIGPTLSVIPLTVYFGISFAFGIKPALTERNWKLVLFLPILFFIQHIAYGLGSLSALFGYRVVRWK